MSLDDSLKYHKVLFSNDSTVKCKALEKKKENNNSTSIRHWPLRRFKQQMNPKAEHCPRFHIFQFPTPYSPIPHSSF